MSPKCHKYVSLQLMHELHLYTNLRGNAQRIALTLQPNTQPHIWKLCQSSMECFRWSCFYRPWLGPLFSCLSFLIGLLMAKAGKMKECKMEVCTAGYTAQSSLIDYIQIKYAITSGVTNGFDLFCIQKQRSLMQSSTEYLCCQRDSIPHLR